MTRSSRGIAVHPTQDLVFIVDAHNHRIRSFRSDGTAVTQWGAKGVADGQFRRPSGVAILVRAQDRILQKHPTQNWVFVTDSLNNRIQVFSIDGLFIRKWGSKGRDDGQFKLPTCVAVLARSQDRGYPTQDLVFVTDFFGVQVFGSDGTFIRKWGAQISDYGQLSWPCGLVAHPTRDLIFICAESRHHIQAFRSDGTFLYQWGSEGSADGQFSFPRHLALHPTRDLLFVADCANWTNHNIHVFNLDGSFLCKWGSKGKAADVFSFLKGISVHPFADVLYVSNFDRVQVFSLFPTMRKRKRISDS